jgi:Amt family ammonium transporter
MKRLLGLLALFAITCSLALAQTDAPVPDPSGANTGKASDIAVKDPAAPTGEELLAAIGRNKIAINMMWTLLAGFLVMFMQTGFAMVETGLTQAKNVAHTVAMNFLVYPIGMLGFYICGFAIMFGGFGSIATLGGYAGLSNEISISLFGKDFGLFGGTGFFLTGGSYDVAVFALFLFQMVFMDTTATIPTGAMAERWKYSSFIVYGLLVGAIIYPLYGNWVWGGGWLAALGRNFGLGHGHVDFAGSSVVHLTGGVLALVGAWIIGPRIGKFRKDGTPVPVPGHSIPMAMFGTFILAFGWFGFNAGSTLAGVDLRISVIAVNTMLAGATGAVAVHGFNGAWGCLALGLFADGTYGDGWNGASGTVRGLFYGDATQFVAQLIGVGANIVAIGIMGFVMFKLIDLTIGLRADARAEIEGLDVPEMGVPGYVGVSDGLLVPEHQMKSTFSTAPQTQTNR